MKTLEDRFGTKQSIADAIGITLSALIKGVDERSTLSVESLLELARFAKESPDHVLRMAAKAHVADLIHELYGIDADRPTPADWKKFEQWMSLDARSRYAIALMMERLAPASTDVADDEIERRGANNTAPHATPPSLPAAAPAPSRSRRR